MSKPKQFARKSTAPIVSSISNQNILTNNTNNSQLVSSLNTKPLQQNKTPITTVLSAQHQNKSASDNLATQAAIDTNEAATSATPVKQFRHKIVSCKPFYQSKATECYPSVRDASTQVDLDEIKLQHTVVPIPVPINVPIPMFMYQAPMPIPILLPVPIPIPVFIPTTKKTHDRVQRRIRVSML